MKKWLVNVVFGVLMTRTRSLPRVLQALRPTVGHALLKTVENALGYLSQSAGLRMVTHARTETSTPPNALNSF